jgi:hypothetical protein
VNPLHAERLTLDHARLWLTNNYFNARLDKTDGLEQVEGDCGYGCHFPLHLSASMASNRQQSVEASARWKGSAINLQLHPIPCEKHLKTKYSAVAFLVRGSSFPSSFSV